MILAYFQAKTKLEWSFYTHAPTELYFPKDTVLKVDIQLYGIPVSGLHLYHIYIYIYHHERNLNLERTNKDPASWYERKRT